MAKKTFVLDTNILLADPNAIFSFQDNEIILPFVVLEELDRHKSNQGEIGLNAREVSRQLHDLLKVAERQTMKRGISLPNGGKLKVVSSSGFISELNEELGVDKADNHILAVCLGVKKSILVTNDMLLRVKADAYGIPNQDYRKNAVADSIEHMYSGVTELFVSKETLGDLWNKQRDRQFLTEFVNNKLKDLQPNEFVHIKNGGSNKPFLVRKQEKAVIFVPEEYELSKVKPRNLEQRLALDLLMDESINLVTIVGKAGTGKTLLALAAGLEQVVEKKKYKSLLVCRPVQPLGKDIGFLPGPQPLDAKIATPDGWTTMGNISVGDLVVAKNGLPTKVVGVFPKGKKAIYRITTTDGTSTEACEDHLWLTQTAEDRKRKKSGSIKTTKQIIQTLKTKNGRNNHFLPRNEAVHYNETQPLPIAPYTLGCLLGDGSIASSISIISKDEELIERMRSELALVGCEISQPHGLQYNIRTKNKFSNKPAKQVRLVFENGEEKIFNSIGHAAKHLGMKKSKVQYRCISNSKFNGVWYEYLPCPVRWQNPLKEQLEKLGLTKTKANTKFIPEIYKYSSIQSRISLLQGLMDTDGSIKKNGEALFTTTSKQLGEDVVELVRSLGGRAKLRSRNRSGHFSVLKNEKRAICPKHLCYEFTVSLPQHINPFFIKRKASRHRCKYIKPISISSIEFVGEKEAQCILIDDKEHLYLTDEFIVTHNSKEEKMEPWIAPIKDNLRFLLTSDGRKSKNSEVSLNYYFDRGLIEVEAMTYIRGRSIADAYMIIDEAQNLSAHELKTIITRVGEGTKIVLTGDVEQIDNMYVDSVSNGLAVAVERFKEHSIAGHITLKKGERSSLATLGSRIL